MASNWPSLLLQKTPLIIKEKSGALRASSFPGGHQGKMGWTLRQASRPNHQCCMELAYLTKSNSVQSIRRLKCQLNRKSSKQQAYHAQKEPGHRLNATRVSSLPRSSSCIIPVNYVQFVLDAKFASRIYRSGVCSIYCDIYLLFLW